MKKILSLLAVVFLLSGCTVSGNVDVSVEKKSITSVCDWFGLSSDSIITQKSEEGYRFTGRTRNWYCENLLMFELKENIR